MWRKVWSPQLLLEINGEKWRHMEKSGEKFRKVEKGDGKGGELGQRGGKEEREDILPKGEQGTTKCYSSFINHEHLLLSIMLLSIKL